MTECSHSISVGDFLVVSEKYPALSVGVSIVDTPYDKHTHDNYRQGGGDEKRRGVRTVSTGRDLEFESLTPARRAAYAQEIARITRRWVIAFTDDHGFDPWRRDFEAAGLEYVRQLVWVRGGHDIDPVSKMPAVRGTKGAPQFTADRPAAGHELMILCHRPGKKRWNGRGAKLDGTGGKRGGGSVYFADIVTEGRLQDAQKPLPLLEELVRDFTDPGEMIGDYFCGSGTTILAAKNMGRSAIGVEVNAGRAAAARQRCGL